MPDWIHSTSTTSWGGDVWAPTHRTAAQVQQSYEEYQQECERQDRIMERRLREQAELEEDKRKYPLFFLKDGIV